MEKAPDNVGQLMSKDVVTVGPDETVAAALRSMIDRDIGSVVVVEAGAALGVFTERDLTRGILDDPGLLERSVQHVMSSPAITAAPDEEIVFVFKRMNEKKIRRLPVVEDGRVVGIVTERDLMRWVGQVAGE